MRPSPTLFEPMEPGEEAKSPLLVGNQSSTLTLRRGRMTNKECTKCGETKPVAEFRRCRAKRSGRQCWCKACTKKRESTPEVRAHRILANSALRAAHQGHAALNTPKGELAAKLEAHGGACDVCGVRQVKRPAVDHCHDMGRARGMLCSTCNRTVDHVLRNLTGYVESAREDNLLIGYEN